MLDITQAKWIHECKDKLLADFKTFRVPCHYAPLPLRSLAIMFRSHFGPLQSWFLVISVSFISNWNFACVKNVTYFFRKYCRIFYKMLRISLQDLSAFSTSLLVAYSALPSQPVMHSTINISFFSFPFLFFIYLTIFTKIGGLRAVLLVFKAYFSWKIKMKEIKKWN